MKERYQPDAITNMENGNNHKKIIPAVFLLILLVIMTYSGAVNNNFVSWDDSEFVLNNKLVRDAGNTKFKEIFSTVVSLNYHPITILSLRLNNNTCRECQDGISARPFITGNIILHTLNTILVFFLIYMLFKKNLLIAFIVAALFGVHPMHVESVAWVSGRKDVLNSFFFLSGLIVYIRFIRSGRRRYILLALAFLLFIHACLSKATAVVFPVILLLLEYFMYNEEGNISYFKSLKNIFKSRIILPLVPFFAVSLFFGLMALHIQNGENFLGMLRFIKEPDDVVNIVGPFTALQKIQIASYGFCSYAIRFLFPAGQSAFYPYPPLTEINHGGFSILLWTALLVFIITFFLVIYSLKKSKLYLFLFGFYVVTLALVLQVISVGTAMVADRYTYLPYIALAAIPAYFISESSPKIRKPVLFITVAFIIIMLLLARNQVKVWHDTESLWTQVIKQFPESERARNARGKYYTVLSSQATDAKVKRILEDKALADFMVPIRKNTLIPDVYEGAGVILISRSDFKNALQMLNTAVKLNPGKGRTWFNRAVVFDQLGQKENAIRDYSTALSLDPGMAPDILRNRSVLYIETGKYSEAIKDLDELIRIDNREFTSYYNRAFSRLMMKDIDGAISDYMNALKLNPGDKATQDHLRVLLEAKKTK